VNEANATVNGEGTNEVSDDSDGEDFCEECAGQIVYFGAKITNWFPVIRGAVASTQGEALSMSHIHSFPPQALLHSSFYLAPIPALSLFTITGAEEEGASSADEGISLCYSDGEDGTADFSVEMESDGEAGDESVAASARAGLRTSKRSTKYSGSMEEVSVHRFAKRPNGAGHKYHPPRADKQTAWTQRQRNKKRSRRCYAERSRAVAAAKLAVCDVARKKLDVALENFRRAKKGWGDAVSADPSRLNLVFRENALLKRVQVVRAYIGHMIETRWSQRQLKQKAVAKEYFVSPKLVAMWTSDFLRAENTTAAGSFRPLNFSPINPYTAPAHSKPHVNDERVRSQCHWFVRTSAIGKGCPNLKAEGFQKWVNSVLIPKLIPDHKPIWIATGLCVFRRAILSRHKCLAKTNTPKT
jgi:hypothetical protein